MKITNAHYAYMKGEIEKFSSAYVDARRAAIVKEVKAQDIEKRLRWDLCYAANLSAWFSARIYTYANDDHIDTALKKIMRELYGVHA